MTGEVQRPALAGAGELDRGTQPGGVGLPLAEQPLLPPESGVSGHAQPQG